jgi:hypothetical protein
MMFRELILTLTRNPPSVPSIPIGSIDLTATMDALTPSTTVQYEGKRRL